MSTFVAKERLYKTPGGQVVGENDVVDGSTLAAAVGDEFSMQEARDLGLVDGTPAAAVPLIGEKQMTADADAQRALAAQRQVDQAEALADQSSATDAQITAALADERARAVEAEATAAVSAARVEDLEAVVKDLRQQLADQKSKPAGEKVAVKPGTKPAGRQADKQAKPADNK